MDPELKIQSMIKSKNPAAARDRSAGLQPAVAPISNRQSTRKPEDVRGTADLSQVINLRYSRLQTCATAQRFSLASRFGFSGFLAGLLPLAASGAAPLPAGSLSDIMVPIYEKGRLKALFTGKNARTQAAGFVLVTEFRLETFHDGNRDQKELVVAAPECLFNPTNYTASSAGRIELATGDGRFRIEGRGFNWDQSSSQLTVSNQVRTVIERGIFLPPADPAAPRGPPTERSNVEVAADRFMFLVEQGLARYEGGVQVVDPGQLRLSCRRATVRVPPGGGRVEQIVVEDQVALELLAGDEPGSASAEKAVYTIAPNGATRIELTGSPTWRTGEYRGQGDRIEVEPAAKRFTVERNASVRLPWHSIQAAGNPAAQNAEAAPRWIDIAAERYQFEPGLGRFEGHVRARAEPDWTLTSGQLEAQLEPEGSRLQRMVATDRVLIIYRDAQGENIARGERAVYSLTASGDEQIELTGTSSWQTPKFEGRGEKLIALPRKDAFRAEGNARLKLLAAAPAPGEPSKMPLSVPIEIQAEEYELENGIVRFHGRVRVDHPDFELDCGQVLARLGAVRGQVRQIDAQQNVVVTQKTNAIARARATNTVTRAGGVPIQSNVPWKFFCEEMQMQLSETNSQIERVEARKNVVFSQGATRATGGGAVYTAADERIRLTERPELVTADGKKILNATTLLLDRIRNEFYAEGPYRVEVSAEALEQRGLGRPGPNAPGTSRGP